MHFNPLMNLEKYHSNIPGMLQGLPALAAASNWIWGIALPMTIAGIATHYLTWMRARWAAFWQQNEQCRSAPVSQYSAF